MAENLPENNPRKRPRLAWACAFACVGALAVFLVVALLPHGQPTSRLPVPQPRVSIASDPPGATVFLNGRLAGATPLAVTGLDDGTYGLRFEKAGHRAVSRALKVSGGAASLLETLPPLPAGTLTVATEPAGAEVLLDAEVLGHTPLLSRPVSAGMHELLIRKTNYESYAKRIEIPPGQELTFSGFELKDKVLEMLTNQVKDEPQRVAHYADLGHYLFVNDKMDAAVEAFSKGLEVLRKPLDFDGPGFPGRQNLTLEEVKLEERLRIQDESSFRKELDKHRNWPGKDTKAFRNMMDEMTTGVRRKDRALWEPTEQAGQEQIRNRNYERAVLLYRDFLASAPNSPDAPKALLALLEVHCMQGDVNRAGEVFERFYARCAQDGPLLRRCGGMLYPYWERVKDKLARPRVLQMAERALRRSLELNPEGEAKAQALFDLGTVLLYENHPVEAADALKQAVEATPDPATREERTLRLGEAYRKAGNLRAAREVFVQLNSSERPGIREKARNSMIFVNTDETRPK